MTDKLPFMPLYVSDYLADTVTLTCEEHGAYLLLLLTMWKCGGELPHDDVALCRIARLPLPRWEKIRSNVIPFFRVSGAVLTHKRVAAELESAKDLSRTRSEVGKRGAEAKRLKSLEGGQAIASPLLKQRLSKGTSKGEPSHISHTITSSSITTTAAPARDEERRAAPEVEIGKRITDLMGLTDDPNWAGSWSSVTVWLSQGFDPELDIWPVVSGIIERKKRAGQRMPGSLKYFTTAIAEHHKQRVAAHAERVANPSTEYLVVKKGSKAFNAWLSHYKRIGRKTTFFESRGEIAVPTEFPNAE